MKYENNMFISEEAFYDKQFKNPVYIVLMHSGTPLANVIKKATGDEFSHACIAFNSKLDPLYSFGSKGNGEHGTGFAVNSPKDKFFDKYSAKYSVYVMYVSNKAYRSMKERLQYFIDKKDKLKYDIKGLIDIWFNNDSEDHEKWFCSRFVMEIVSKAQELSKVPSLWKPQDITNLDNISLVNRGFNFYNYDYKITERHCKDIKHHQYDPSDVLYEGISDSTAKDMGSKKTVSLSSYSKMGISDSFIQVYKKEFPRLSHVRVNNHTKGYVWLDGNELVAMVNVEEKDDDSKWIQGLEVFGSYKGQGLAKQVLDMAVKNLGATRLAVQKNNEIAIHTYKSYGFKIDKTTDSGYYMVLKSAMDESATVRELNPTLSEDCKISADMAREKLKLLKKENQMKFCKSRAVEPTNEGWVFGEYTIDSESSAKELQRFIRFINEIVKTSNYRGCMEMPDLSVGNIGKLYIKEGSVYDTLSESLIGYGGTIYNAINEAGDNVKYFKNPARQLKVKKSKKQNVQSDLGDYTDVGSYDASSFSAAPSTGQKSSNESDDVDNVDLKDLEQAADKARKAITKEIVACRDYCSAFETVMKPYLGSNSFAVIRWNITKVDNADYFASCRETIYKYAKKSFEETNPGYYMKMDDSCFFITK